MKGNIRITWRCSHQKEATIKTCKKTDCTGSWYYRVRYGERDAKVGGWPKQKKAEKEGSETLSRWVLHEDDDNHKQKKLKVSDLMERYLADCRARIEDGTLEDSTYDGYETNARVYIIPLLGDVYLNKGLNHQRVKEWHRDCRKVSPKLSGTSLRRINTSLSIAWNFGARAEMITTPINPCKGHTFPASTFTAKTWSTDSIRCFWDLAQRDKYFVVYATALLQGARRGEALGMHEEAIDQRNWVWTVNVQITAKSSRKRETSRVKTKLKTFTEGIKEKKIALGPEMIHLVKGLIERRARLQREAEEAGRFFYQDPDGRSLLMIDENGYPFDPIAVTKHMKYLCDMLDLPVIRLHDLRHTFITYMRRAQVDPLLVKEMVGHTPTSSVTDDYTHFEVDDQRAVIKMRSAALGLVPSSDAENVEDDDPPDNVVSLRG
jgi:integrase